MQGPGSYLCFKQYVWLGALWQIGLRCYLRHHIPYCTAGSSPGTLCLCILRGSRGWSWCRESWGQPWPLASAWPSPNSCKHLGKEPVDKRSLFFFLSAFQINNTTLFCGILIVNFFLKKISIYLKGKVTAREGETDFFSSALPPIF